MKKGTLFTDLLRTATRYFSVIMVIVVVGILCSGIRIIKTGNQAIILRMGKIVGSSYEEQVHGPGLLLAFPYIIDEVIVVPKDQVFQQNVTVHDSGADTGKTARDGYVMTGDNSIALISASVKYTVSDPVRYALNVADLPGIIDAAVGSAMVSQSACRDVDSLLTDQKDSFARAILDESSGKMDALGTGITITGIELTKVAMPEEVREIYEQVNSAQVHVSTRLSQAKQYREKIIPAAQARADSIVAQAEAAYSRRIAESNRDLAEFWGVLEEYRTDPQRVTSRIYSRKVTEFLSRIGSVRVVEDGQTNLFLDPNTPED